VRISPSKWLSRNSAIRAEALTSPSSISPIRATCLNGVNAGFLVLRAKQTVRAPHSVNSARRRGGAVTSDRRIGFIPRTANSHRFSPSLTGSYAVIGCCPSPARPWQRCLIRHQPAELNYSGPCSQTGTCRGSSLQSVSIHRCSSVAFQSRRWCR
jgi:hypothetical protein